MEKWKSCLEAVCFISLFKMKRRIHTFGQKNESSLKYQVKITGLQEAGHNLVTLTVSVCNSCVYLSIIITF